MFLGFRLAESRTGFSSQLKKKFNQKRKPKPKDGGTNPITGIRGAGKVSYPQHIPIQYLQKKIRKKNKIFL